MQHKIAVITGAAQGLGLGTAEHLAKLGYTVCLLGRNAERIQKAAQGLSQKGFRAEAFVVDVSDTAATEAFGVEFNKLFEYCDILINNAGVFPEFSGDGVTDPSALKVSESLIADTFSNNTLSALRMVKALASALARTPRGYSCIVNVSSGMGQLSEMNGQYPAYRLSKTALNSLTRILAEELQGQATKVNSVCPGWVRTEMGGANAERSLEEGVSGIVWAATLPKEGPTGGFFRDGKRLEW